MPACRSGAPTFNSGVPANAIPHLEAALDTDDDGSLHYQLARAYQATGQAELAKTMMGEVCRAREGETKWT
jgi:hypothetical protein